MFLFAEIRVYEQEVIIVPILLLAAFLVTLVFIFLLRFCPEKVDRIRPQASKPATRRVLHGIDGKTLDEAKFVCLYLNESNHITEIKLDPCCQQTVSKLI